MKKWRCKICNYIYDPAVGIPEDGIEPGTPFEDLDDEKFRCPVCSAMKKWFEPLE